MSNVKSLLAHRIKQSSVLIEQVEPLVRSALAAARDRRIESPLTVLADTMIWRSKLIVALAELDQAELTMALADFESTAADDRKMLSALQTEMCGLIDAVAELSAALLPRQRDQ